MILLGVGNRPGVDDPGVPPLELVVALDRTTSMDATDGSGVPGSGDESRLDVAEQTVQRLLDALPEAEVSLVTFGAKAEVVVPFTSDRALLRDRLDAITTEPPTTTVGSSLSRPLPFVQGALEIADAQDSGAERRRAAVVLVGDGEDTADVAEAGWNSLRDSRDAGLVLGVGTAEGSTMPITGEVQPLIDPTTGEPAVSKADFGNLETVARQLDVPMVRVRATGRQATDVDTLARELRAQAYADLPEARSSREVTWLWALLLLAFVLFEVRYAWREVLVVRREARA
ncbi:vWA domain-containing protein [Nocardioides acrostichi]|nr:VWA domain-containing protein [Nocardioides acrostichi]